MRWPTEAIARRLYCVLCVSTVLLLCSYCYSMAVYLFYITLVQQIYGSVVAIIALAKSSVQLLQKKESIKIILKVIESETAVSTQWQLHDHSRCSVRTHIIATRLSLERSMNARKRDHSEITVRTQCI